MLNLRKLKQDYSPNILKEGKNLQEKGMVNTAKILKLDAAVLRVSSQVLGNFDNLYTCEIEIDRDRSATIDSDCDCPSKYDCQHIAALLFYLDEHLNELIIDFSKKEETVIDGSQKKFLLKTLKEAEDLESVRRGKKHEKELLNEYISASKILGKSPFFMPEEEVLADKAEIAVIFEDKKMIEFQMALRLPFRSKPLHIIDLKQFLDAVHFEESIYLGNKRYCFKQSSFDAESYQILKFLIDYARFPESKTERSGSSEKNPRIGCVEPEIFGSLLAKLRESALSKPQLLSDSGDDEGKTLSCLYIGNLEEPLKFSSSPAQMRFELEYLISSAPKLLLKPSINLADGKIIHLEEACLFESAEPGMIHSNVYYCFDPAIKRKHLKNLITFRDLIIPEPLFGTFVENALPELMRFAKVANRDVIERFTTLPFAGEVGAVCDISYLNGELEASLNFDYGNVSVPASSTRLSVDQITSFSTPDGILARNLTEEQHILEDLFQDFTFDESQGVFVAKTDRKIIEFMTEVIPKNQQRVRFNCPENLMDQFIYDETTFKLHLKESDRIDLYEVDLKVDGHLKGLTLDVLWDCLASKKAYVELNSKKSGTRRKREEGNKHHKILVLNLERLAPVVQIFDEIGIDLLDNHKELRPLFSLASIDEALFKGLPIEFKITPKLLEIQKQMLGLTEFKPKKIPSEIQAVPRSYQLEGISWLERLRHMHLGGILADDMGLGKTLQAIVALTQQKKECQDSLSIVVCPTSLVYNWKEEIGKFNPKLKALPVDGTPSQRKKLLSDIEQYDVIITSYSLLQKDIDFYKSLPFSYAILDEAQHIKNRGTRNAKSVKMIQAKHRLILTGTPIENSLEELWSLFDFLMPGLLSSYERFIEKYVRNLSNPKGSGLENLRKKVVPFILRRMKTDVLSELPPVSDIVYHCHLSPVQQELYRSYADSAREELSKLVKKEGFDRVQIHVLATLTRLKQICCHPAIFAKEDAEIGDSSKYDMLIELLQSLIEGRHKTVIFSQYTRMLQIMREDLQKLGIRFEYLDGSSKNRLSIVKKFNEDPTISVFLVSLKAGGAGLNLVGADTVIHYDLWWNPAVENQATDRVHRLGQKKSVSSYKLVTLNTIEEKIIELQDRKRELVKQVVSCDEEAIAKLTWEEVLELLQTY
ncbi:hypothetical protein PHSC3_001106 [Chlamydiales bacterium STE3]|nr:hypothetical protein PHSC3_001106 [Chlamydiales bacterium STE3]